ncbi:MAG TPA: BMP family ABC transporter substrate-binding protein [Candidatus Sulfomarinibacteraceae bacterium]|nr:BMP family ABC transporter substrate-binding protein [Candidatus Sulfomarinibacteraceae bacterium]
MIGVDLPRALVLAGAVALAGCAGNPGGVGSPGGAGTAPPAATPLPTPAAVTRIAVAYDLSGRGDGGFNDIAYNGARQAADELGAELREVTARLDDTDDDRAERLRLLAGAGYDPIIAVGFTYALPMQEVAAEFPEVEFAIVDDGTVSAPNVQGILFAEHEGSFLVGAAAGLTTSTNVVGFIGAVQIPLLGKFEAGYTAGARHVNPGVAVQVRYLSQPPDYSGFGDPPHGREAALGMYENGVDVIFAAAGGSGSGVHEAAAETGRWSIGVDADEYVLAPAATRSHILTSMLKNANVGTHAFVMSVASRTFQPGNRTFGLANGGVGYATSGGFVDGIRDRLDAIAAEVVAGRIVVPDAP